LSHLSLKKVDTYALMFAIVVHIGNSDDWKDSATWPRP
jgi:hypothetical protein